MTKEFKEQSIYVCMYQHCMMGCAIGAHYTTDKTVVFQCLNSDGRVFTVPGWKEILSADIVLLEIE